MARETGDLPQPQLIETHGVIIPSGDILLGDTIKNELEQNPKIVLVGEYVGGAQVPTVRQREDHHVVVVVGSRTFFTAPKEPSADFDSLNGITASLLVRTNPTSIYLARRAFGSSFEEDPLGQKYKVCGLGYYECVGRVEKETTKKGKVTEVKVFDAAAMTDYQESLPDAGSEEELERFTTPENYIRIIQVMLYPHPDVAELISRYYNAQERPDTYDWRNFRHEIQSLWREVPAGYAHGLPSNLQKYLDYLRKQAASA